MLGEGCRSPGLLPPPPLSEGGGSNTPSIYTSVCWVYTYILQHRAKSVFLRMQPRFGRLSLGISAAALVYFCVAVCAAAVAAGYAAIKVFCSTLCWWYGQGRASERSHTHTASSACDRSLGQKKEEKKEEAIIVTGPVPYSSAVVSEPTEVHIAASSSGAASSYEWDRSHQGSRRDGRSHGRSQNRVCSGESTFRRGGQ